MSSPAFVAFKAELETIRDKYRPKLEGWEDFRRLNLVADGHTKADEGIASRGQFVEAIEDALRALGVLATVQYPSPPPIRMDPAIRANYRENLDTLLAAFDDTEATAGEAVDGRLKIHAETSDFTDLESQ